MLNYNLIKVIFKMMAVCRIDTSTLYANLFIINLDNAICKLPLLTKYSNCSFLLESNQCSKCNITSTTEHALFFCVFPTYFVHKLALFLDYFLNDGRPEFIFLKETFYLFNMFYERFSNNFFLKLTHLILVEKIGP